LHASPVAALAIPAKSAARAKNAKSEKAHGQLLLSCFLSNVQKSALTHDARSA